MKANQFGSVGAWIVALALLILGLILLTAGRGASAAIAANPPTTSHHASPSLVPRVTVIVDNTPALRAATGIVLNPAATTAWVTEETAGDGRLLRVDLASGSFTPIATRLNQPGHLVVSGTLVFVAGNIGTPVTLVRIDLNHGTVTSVSNELGGGLSGVAVNRALTQAHVVNLSNGVLSRVDIDPSSPTFQQVTQVVSGLDGPRDIVMNDAGTLAYITEQNAGRLVSVDTDPASPGYGTVLTIAIGMNGPRGLTLDPTGSLAYVAQEWGGELCAVNLSTGVVTDVIGSLTGPRDVSIASAQQWAWVTVHQALVAIDINPASPTYGTQVQRVDGGPPLDGARGLDLNANKTIAYVVSEFSGKLSRVDIDPTSPTYGTVTHLAGDLLILNDVDINRAETLAFVSREAGPTHPPVGRNVVTRVNLTTGEAVTVTDQVGHPSNIVLSRDETEGYVVDLHHSIPGEGGLYRVNLASGVMTPVVMGLNLPFAVAVNRTETLAYVGTIAPVGSLLRIDLRTGQVITVADEMVSDISGMTLSADERRAYVTDFGAGADCTGKLSVVDIDPTSPSYGEVTSLLTGLCGPHDVRLDEDEMAAYVVEVDGRRLIRVDLLRAIYLPVALKSHKLDDER